MSEVYRFAGGAVALDPEVMDFYDENVVKMISDKYGFAPSDALPMFLSSRTYRMLADPKMEMWQFGPAGIFDMWESERVTGSPLNSPYPVVRQGRPAPHSSD